MKRIPSFGAAATMLLVALAPLVIPWAANENHAHIASPDSLGPPLKSLMVELGLNMEKINAGIWREDYRLVSQGAAGIANHPQVSTQEQAIIREALGDQIKNFAQFDGLVHRTAAEIQRVADTQRMDSILVLYSHLQNGCVSCHSGFRMHVRSALNAALPDR